MSQIDFSSDWLKLLSSDPYAVFGVSLTADELRIKKRYRALARLLHPDKYLNADDATRGTMTQVFARLVSPASQKLDQEKERNEILAFLRLKARRMSREVPTPQTELARQLLNIPEPQIEIFYEQSVTQIAEQQYQTLTDLQTHLDQLHELNLVYLRLKMGEIIRPKREGVVPASDKRPDPVPPVEVVVEKSTSNYAQRHYQRAQEYVRKGNLDMAKRELDDALKLDPSCEHHVLLGKIYLAKNLPGMAKYHIRLALRLNPQDANAQNLAKRLDLPVDDSTENSKHATNGKQPANGKQATIKQPSQAAKTAPAGGGLFGGLFARRR